VSDILVLMSCAARHWVTSSFTDTKALNFSLRPN